jgi:hypothetical protein
VKEDTQRIVGWRCNTAQLDHTIASTRQEALYFILFIILLVNKNIIISQTDNTQKINHFWTENNIHTQRVMIVVVFYVFNQVYPS